MKSSSKSFIHFKQLQKYFVNFTYANKLRKHIHLKISQFPQSLGGAPQAWHKDPSFPHDRPKLIWLRPPVTMSLLPPPEAESIFRLEKLSPNLPFQRLRPHSSHQKLKTPLLQPEAKFPPHTPLARSTWPLTEADGSQFWLQQSPGARDYILLPSLESKSLLLDPKGKSSELSSKVRSTLPSLEAESGFWLHRQYLPLTWEAVPLLSFQRMRTHCWLQSLSPNPSSRGWVSISESKCQPVLPVIPLYFASEATYVPLARANRQSSQLGLLLSPLLLKVS